MRKLLVIAGESSGDIHGGNLVREIRKLSPETAVYAAGGQRLKEAGATLLVDLVQHAVIGAVEVLKHYHEFRKIFNRLLAFLDRERPDAVILIDYPGFNLKFARAAKRRGIRVVYYISPQIWAWAPGRITQIRESVDQMIVILPFEREIYEKAGVRVSFVGHPILDVLREDAGGDLRSHYRVGADERIIGLLPGSRKNEVRKILPPMLEAAVILKGTMPALKFFISAADDGMKKMIEGIVSQYPLDVVLCGDVYAVMKGARACMVASGTATVQTAFFLTPMVIIYKVAFITWFLGRLLIRIPYIGLVNVIAGKKIIDEFIQFDARPDRIAAAVRELIASEQKYRSVKDELRIVKERLGEPGASARAARAVIDFLGETCKN